MEWIIVPVGVAVVTLFFILGVVYGTLKENEYWRKKNATQ